MKPIDKSNQQQNRQHILATKSETRIQSGPLPPAEEFARYEQILSGSAERILSMAEREADHRHKCEDKLIDFNIKAGKTGQLFGFIITIGSLIALFLSIVLNRPLGSIAPAFLAITGLAAIFTGNKKK